MNSFQLITEYSLWFTIVCLLAAAGYSFLLYTRQHSWSKKINIALAAIRFILVFGLCFLLIGPFFKHLKNSFESPAIVIAVDNSQSIRLSNDSAYIKTIKYQLAKLKQSLQRTEANVEIRTLDQAKPISDPSKISFQASNTNLSKLLTEVESDYANRNLSGVVLLSDGIYNAGMAPNYNQYTFPLHTIGLGDTIPKKDIAIKSLLYNKVAYTGNRFSIMAEVSNTGFSGARVNVSVRQNNKILDQKSIVFKANESLEQVEFSISSEVKGLQHYVIESTLLNNEYIKENNTAHAYIEIIEGKEKILLVAAAPHPDIKAIRSALEKKDNYELDVYIPFITQYKEAKYDLVIFHQIPDTYNSATEIKQKILNGGTSLLYINGSQTNHTLFNNENQVLKIAARPGQMDNVTPTVNSNFQKFNLQPADINTIKEYPPVVVPFGTYTLGAGSEIILFQQVGQVVTDKPLLSIATTGNRKVGVLAGAGIWQWQLQEYNLTQETKVFDKLITSLVQFLSSKEDKRKFRVYPVNQEFINAEPVAFQVEIYNDIYEKIYGQKITLTIVNENKEKKEYSFVNSENFSKFDISGLKQGVYKYTAVSTIDGKPTSTSGEFSVREVNIEAMNITADHNMLRLLSSQSGGNFYHSQQMEDVLDNFNKNKMNKVIHTNEAFEEFINLPIIFFLLLALISAEWFIRKYHGSY